MVDHQRREFEKNAPPYIIDYRQTLQIQSERNSEYEAWIQESRRMTEQSSEKTDETTQPVVESEEETTTESGQFMPDLESEEIQKEIKSISYEPEEQKANLEISENDFELLEKLVFAETATDTFEAKVSVAACVLNRQRIHWDNMQTIADVISEAYQFADITYLTEKRREDWDTPEIRRAVWEALLGSDPAGERLGEPTYAFYIDQGLSDYEAYARKDLTSKVHTKDGSITWFLGKTGIGECHWD